MRFISPTGLQLYLVGLIFLIASLCLFSTAAYILYQTSLDSRYELYVKAESMNNKLENQLLQIITKDSSFRNFPNLTPTFDKRYSNEGCIQYIAIDRSIVKNTCYGGLATSTNNLPQWFEKLYHWVFHPKYKLVRLITYNNQIRGELTLTSDANLETNRAWHDVKKLMSLFTVTLSSLCIMLFFSLGRALKPADIIVSKLESMAQGDLSKRIPDFKMVEWQRTARAINHLSENLEKTLAEKNKLTIKLMNAQDEERQFITRELHDVFGQCLAGMQATAFSLKQTAQEKCHELVEDCQNISIINSQMMEHLRNILKQLHHSSIEELGLTVCLKSIITSWNARSNGKTRYTLDIDNNIDSIPSDTSNHIFRIVQESLTNISKHSKAKNAKVKIEIANSYTTSKTKQYTNNIFLTITDDGLADNTSFLDSDGIGLLGIRERVIALGGKLTLSNNIPSGLILQLWIPIQHKSDSKNDTT